MRLCSIIIPTYNALQYTRLCINSLFHYTNPPHELILVDNGSQDGTVNYLTHIAQLGRRVLNDLSTNAFSSTKTKYHSNAKRILVLKNSSNLGFAKACNQGARSAQGETLLFLNNDTVVTYRWLENLLSCLDSDSRIGIVTPCSNCTSQGHINVRFRSMPEMQHFAQNFNRSNSAKWRENNIASGFCLLIRKILFENLKGFDECFETGFYEDTDLTLRAHQAGLKVIIAGDTYVHHFGSQSFMANGLNINQLMTVNSKKFHHKHPNQI